MIFYRSIITMVILLSCTCYTRAQDNHLENNDTTIIKADSVEGKENEDYLAPEEFDEDEHPADTLLRDNQLFVEPDSVLAVKNSKPFSYSKNLDSLLIAYQRRLEKEGASDNNTSSWLERFFLSPITKYFFWILAGVFVSFILYKLFFTTGFFQQSYAKSNVNVLPFENENSIAATDFDILIAQAISDNNYRMAVRYHYLQTLQKLTLAGAIQFAIDKTNYQYISELSGKTYKNTFASLTLHYEYVWYGEIDIDESVFNSIQRKFVHFNIGL